MAWRLKQGQLNHLKKSALLVAPTFIWPLFAAMRIRVHNCPNRTKGSFGSRPRFRETFEIERLESGLPIQDSLSRLLVLPVPEKRLCDPEAVCTSKRDDSVSRRVTSCTFEVTYSSLDTTKSKCIRLDAFALSVTGES